MPEEVLPSFRNPPVVETVLGIQFSPLPGLSNAHLGAFWKFLAASDANRAIWDKVTDVPPLPPVHEHFNGERAWERGLTLSINQGAGTRLQIRDTHGVAMVQVQNGRLHYNWIGHGADAARQGNQEYRRYPYVSSRFREVHAIFADFLTKEELGVMSANQWEVTYVNHINEGTVWKNPSDWSRLFVGLPSINARTSTAQLEALAGTWHFGIPDKRGRLHVDLRLVKPPEQSSKRMLRLTLTARGPVSDGTGDGLGWADGLDLGHRVIVLSFKELTSREAHQHWELEP